MEPIDKTTTEPVDQVTTDNNDKPKKITKIELERRKKSMVRKKQMEEFDKLVKNGKLIIYI